MAFLLCVRAYWKLTLSYIEWVLLKLELLPLYLGVLYSILENVPSPLDLLTEYYISCVARHPKEQTLLLTRCTDWPWPSFHGPRVCVIWNVCTYISWILNYESGMGKWFIYLYFSCSYKKSTSLVNKYYQRGSIFERALKVLPHCC